MKHLSNRKAGRFLRTVYLFILFFSMTLSCEKTDFNRVLRIKTGEVFNITPNTATVTGFIQDVGESGILKHGHCWSVEENPTANSMPTTNLGSRDISGSFSSELTGLLPGTYYFVRSYATSHTDTAYGDTCRLLTPAVDYDGNLYPVVQIGQQMWMAENLKTTRYNDGSVIPFAPDKATWEVLATGQCYCWYNDSKETYKNPYGALYNWHTINSGKLCPSGWHVPDNDDWTTLVNFLGGEAAAGGKLKETGTAHWNSPNTGATNESGFTALPGGFRFGHGLFDGFGWHCIFWSSTEYNSDYAWGYAVTFDNNSVGKGGNNKMEGFSIRCIRD